ncbi:MAG: glycerol kinase [Cyanobacteria bacterium]|nr:glycerol kinase [Cyanobacteriota bacterium]
MISFLKIHHPLSHPIGFGHQKSKAPLKTPVLKPLTLQPVPSKEKPYLLVLDHGTTGIRAMIMDRHGEFVAKGYQKFKQIQPKPGWVEHNPKTLWTVTQKVIEEAFQNLGDTPIQWHKIQGIAITNQRETTILWDAKTGKPIANAIVWQCRRTQAECETLKNIPGAKEKVQAKTGLLIDPYFSATKIKWLLDNTPEAKALLKEGRLRFGTVDSWILWQLSGGKSHVTDTTNASRTMLFNINTQQWDPELLDLFGIPKEILPTVLPSDSIFGTTNPALTGGIAVPLAGCIGDQQGALFGQKCWETGTAKSTFGTGAFLLMNIGETPIQSKNGLLTTLIATPPLQKKEASDKSTEITLQKTNDSDASKIQDEKPDSQKSHPRKPHYGLEGSIFAAGSVLEWLQKIGILKNIKEIDTLLKDTPSSGDVQLIPAFNGLGTPFWKSDAKAMIEGISLDTEKRHIIRAALESIGLMTREVIATMEKDSGVLLKQLKVDGGVTKSNIFMQFLADILNIPIIRNKDVELTAKGAGLLGGLATGFWPPQESNEKGLEPSSNTEGEPQEVFTPKMQAAERNQLIQKWQASLKKVLN